MKVQVIFVGSLQTNCYVISTENNNAVIIDCGDEANKILAYTEKEGLTIKKILLTHGHYDHIGAVAEIAKKTGAEVFIHENDKPMLTSEEQSLSKFIPNSKLNVIEQVTTIDDGDIIAQDELEFKVMHTKGHTKGGVCYICEDIIFSGDTLFCGDVGRTDLPGGNYQEILESVKRLAKLEGDYKVFPGHGFTSTLEKERKTNMYIKGNIDDYNF